MEHMDLHGLVSTAVRPRQMCPTPGCPALSLIVLPCPWLSCPVLGCSALSLALLPCPWLSCSPQNQQILSVQISS